MNLFFIDLWQPVTGRSFASTGSCLLPESHWPRWQAFMSVIVPDWDSTLQILASLNLTWTETHDFHFLHTGEVCVFSTLENHREREKKITLMSLEPSLSSAHCLAPSSAPPVPTELVIITTNIIYANVIRPRNTIAEHEGANGNLPGSIRL